MNILINVLLIFCVIFSTSYVQAKKVIYRKSQKVKFDGSAVDGVARSPDGSYLLQKRSKKFLPLYKLKDGFEKKIKNSVDYLR